MDRGYLWTEGYFHMLCTINPRISPLGAYSFSGLLHGCLMEGGGVKNFPGS